MDDKVTHALLRAARDRRNMIVHLLKGNGVLSNILNEFSRFEPD